MALGLGPVFEYEWLRSSRRWQMYATRAFIVGGLLCALWFVWYAEMAGQTIPTTRGQARVGQSFFHAIVGTQLALVLLTAPALTAGTICMDKARGALTHLLVTDLTDGEIVLGKLVSRLIPVVGVVLATQPVMALATLMGGIDPVPLTGATIVALGAGILAATLGLVLSVWGRKTQDVLLLSYALILLWVLGGPAVWMLRWTLAWTWALPEWFTHSNPYWLALAPGFWPGSVGLGDDLAFLGGCLLISCILAAFAVARIRVVASREGGDRTRRRWLPRWITSGVRPIRFPGPSLDPNPVLWREWHRSRPSRAVRFVWAGYGCLVVSVTVYQIDELIRGVGAMRMDLSCILIGGEVAIGLLLLAIRASTSMSEERARGSLDVLLTTPMSTMSILWGKWWGAFRGVLLVSFAPTMILMLVLLKNLRVEALLLAPALILLYGTALTSFGLAVATWVPRPGRAAAITVASYISVTVGWIFFVVMLFPNGNGGAMGVASASPFFGPSFLGLISGQPYSRNAEWTELLIGIAFWCVVYAGITILFFLAAVATFDRCLGRMVGLPDSLDDVVRREGTRGRHRTEQTEGRSLSLLPLEKVPRSGG
jgi:ABC-type transport system involved in multi-copper enzyme maturation permease subunit